jgi:alkylation response protein AidB-like acyl-CoA dehydrogenase
VDKNSYIIHLNSGFPGGSVRRTIFTGTHEQFRQTVRAFLEKECVPRVAEWLEAGVVSGRPGARQARPACSAGWMVPEEYGGPGIDDFRYSVVIAEEIAATGTQGIALALHNDVVAPYLTGELMSLLDGKVAIVTGGGRGLGRAHCLALAAHGAAVVVNNAGILRDRAGDRAALRHRPVRPPPRVSQPGPGHPPVTRPRHHLG